MTTFLRPLLFSFSILAIAATGLHAQAPAPAPAAPTAPTAMPLFEAGPPNSHKGIAWRELFEKPDQWAQTRSRTNELLYADWAFRDFSDDELKAWFAQMNQWGIKLELEVGAIKEWGTTGQVCFQKERANWDRIIRLGGHIDSVAMDEPLTCARGKLHQSDDYAAQETAKFIAEVRQYFPQTAVVEIEPYPYVKLADQLTWIPKLQKALADMNVKPLDGYRLDVNWIVYALIEQGSWKEVKEIEDYCKSVHLPFSLVYWAPGFEYYRDKIKVGDDATWYHLIMQQGFAYAAVGGKPDQYCIESWVNAPAHSVPETDMMTFMRSVNDFYSEFLAPKTP